MSQVPLTEVVRMLRERGRTGVEVLPAPALHQRFHDQSTVLVCPTRVTPYCAQCGGEVGRGEAPGARYGGRAFEPGKCTKCGADATGKIDFQVVDSWLKLEGPMNSQPEGPLFAVGYEVGHAYDALVAGILASPGLRDKRYLLTIEDDQILPWNAHLLLLETIEQARSGDGRPFDAVSGLYYLKRDDVVTPENDRVVMHTPHVYGDPERYRATGKLDFVPVDLDAFPKTQRVIEVTGIPMGCALWKMDLFRELGPPWFTEARKRGQTKTQDLLFSKRCMEAGKRLAVDRSCYTPHKDVSGEIY